MKAGPGLKPVWDSIWLNFRVGTCHFFLSKAGVSVSRNLFHLGSPRGMFAFHRLHYIHRPAK